MICDNFKGYKYIYNILSIMVRSSGYRTSAQKAGKSAGQRKKRMARNRKRQNRESNVYPISIDTSIIKNTRFEDNPVFGIYSDGDSWYLTAMIVKRTREKLVSDRQGAVKSETVDQIVVTSGHNGFDPKDGLVVNSADTKKEIMNSERIQSSTRVDSGSYIVNISDWDNFSTFKVDRDDYNEFKRNRKTVSVR